MDIAGLHALNWEDITVRLALYTARQLAARGSLQEAEEIAQDAIRQLVSAVADGAAEDIPATKVKAWLRTSVDHLLANRSRTKARTMIGSTREATDFDAHEGKSVSHERVIATDELGQQAMDRMLNALDGDDLAVGVLLLEVDGVTTAREQAARLERPVGDVYAARRRLGTARERVLANLRSEVLDA
jgi:DNA-directed RNA polymerase specialized sigma24 family protein